MRLEKRAQVSATPQFIEHLQEAQLFFDLQDQASAQARFKRLKLTIRRLKDMLAWAPACGRPAQLLGSNNEVNSKILTETLCLAESSQLPFLREAMVDQHIILYAHSESKVLLLAIKHQKELRFFKTT